MNIRSMYERVLIHTNQHHINVMMAQEMDHLRQQVDELSGKLAAYEMGKERGQRGLHPALQMMKEKALNNHKM